MKYAQEMVTSNHLVIFDIDGTLADCTHRLHHIKGGATSKNWDAFFADCPNDKPITDNISMLRLMWELGFVIILASGRSSVVKQETIEWLKKHNVPYHDMFMRNKKDHRPDFQTKQDILTNIKMKYMDKKIFCVFDDRDQVVSMWRSHGLRCYQVAPGNF